MDSKELRGIVRDTVATSQYKTTVAREALIDLAARDAGLRKLLIHLGADQAIRTYVGLERSAAAASERHYEPPAATPDSEARQQRKEERRLFWDRYALFGHMPIREATRPDLRTSVDNRRKQAAGNLTCAAFEEAVAERIRGDKKTVSQAMNVDDLVEIAKEHHVI